MKSADFYRRIMIKLPVVLVILVILSLAFCISSYAQPLAYGSLSIDSNPRGARVYLDNNYKGETPLSLKNISVGQYSLKLLLPGYEEWNSTVAVLPILTVKVSTDLVPNAQNDTGSIAVDSNPRGARVYLDNAYKGQTPINLRDISVGRHSIKLLLSGYQEWTREISVSRSQTARVSVDLTSQSDTGSVSIESNPEGADIYLDDDYEGLTPLELRRIRTGRHMIRIMLPGYEEWTREISVSPSQTIRVSADLIPIPAFGTISVSSEQDEAKIFLDGTYQRTTSTRAVRLEDVKEGEHELVIIKDGFKAWVEDVRVYAGEVSHIDISLTEIHY